MLRSLRSQLIFSHILPVLLAIPLTGILLIYTLETRVLQPLIFSELTKEAALMSEITRNQPVFWQKPAVAQALIDGVSPFMSGRLSFISPEGRLIASSESALTGNGVHIIELPDLNQVDQGQVLIMQEGSLAQVFAPVYDLKGVLIGVVGTSNQVLSVSTEIYRLRYLLGAILLAGVAAGVLLGGGLAANINHRVQNVSRSILSLADGNWQTRLDDTRGPDEMRALARAVNALVERLSSLEKARRQLLSNLVHELGRPLGAIRSAILALLKGANQEPQLADDLLHGLHDETIRLQRLLDDLAGLHDQVLGGLELERVACNFGEWLVSQISIWEMAAREKRLNWEVENDLHTLRLEVDTSRMGQALGNLLSNAIKFTPSGGKVSIKTWQEGGQVWIQVFNDGPEIPQEEREKIFQPFYRGTQGRRIIQGMGLGLSIARDIAIAHGGDLELANMPEDAGNTFILHIPCR